MKLQREREKEEKKRQEEGEMTDLYMPESLLILAGKKKMNSLCRSKQSSAKHFNGREETILPSDLIDMTL